MSRGIRKKAVVIDEWAVVRAGIASLLADEGVDVVAEGTDGRDGVSEACRLDADLLVLGAIRGAPAASVIRSARERGCTRAVLVLVSQPDGAEVAELAAAGADALMLRAADESDLAKAARAVLRGERFVAPSLVPVMVAGGNGRTRTTSLLSDRERDVLGRLALGESNAQIASELCIGVSTVKTHLVHIYEKLEVPNRTQALRRALALGILG